MYPWLVSNCSTDISESLIIAAETSITSISDLLESLVLVDENASQGNMPVTVNISSNLYPDIEDGIDTVLKVLPDRLPDIIVPEITPRCSPGSSCNFAIELQNIGDATDVFSLSLSDKNVPNGWSMSLAWNQSTNVLVRVDTPVDLSLIHI